MGDRQESVPPSTPTIEVAVLSERAAVVTVRGEQDVATRADLSAALVRASTHPRVLVDLSECTFMDSTALAVLLIAQRNQEKRDGRLELVIPGGAHPIQRLARLARFDAILTVHETRGAALASIQSKA